MKHRLKYLFDPGFICGCFSPRPAFFRVIRVFRGRSACRSSTGKPVHFRGSKKSSKIRAPQPFFLPAFEPVLQSVL